MTQHIVRELARAIFKMQMAVTTTQAVVRLIAFSTVQVLRMRESCSQPLQKTIYERVPFPSHGGGLEKAFAPFLDSDAEVEAFLKIDETQHAFATVYYIRNDGMLATYHPDFIVKTKDKVCLIETKGNDKMGDENVRSKQRSTLQWISRVNALPAGERMGRQWEYVLLSEDTFYSLSGSGATLRDICQRCKVSAAAATGNLFG